MTNKSKKLFEELKEVLWKLRETGKTSNEVTELIDAYDYFGIADGWAKPDRVAYFERNAQDIIDQYNNKTLKTERLKGLYYVGKSKTRKKKPSKPKKRTIKKCRCK